MGSPGGGRAAAAMAASAPTRQHQISRQEIGPDVVAGPVNSAKEMIAACGACRDALLDVFEADWVKLGFLWRGGENGASGDLLWHRVCEAGPHLRKRDIFFSCPLFRILTIFLSREILIEDPIVVYHENKGNLFILQIYINRCNSVFCRACHQL